MGPMTKKGLIIRHVPHEGIAGFRDPIEAAGYQLDRIDVDDPLFGRVDLGEPDLLIMMGGPQQYLYCFGRVTAVPIFG